jgi:dolichol-phosphate mannosyltransferase
MKLSIISPVYQAESIIEKLVEKIIEAVEDITDDFEIILVEDNSNDNSWEKITDQCEKYSFVKGLKLSKNFGQHNAVSAGVKKATGDNIVLMDCDLQDDPKHIQRLLEKRDDGFDIIFTKRIKRKHGFIKSFNSFLYSKLFAIFSDKKYEINAGSLVLFSSKVASEFNKLKDKSRLYQQMLKWLGFNVAYVDVEHNPRYEGKSSYSFVKLVKLGIEGWTSHSDKLLRLSIYFGLFLSLISFILVIVILFRYLFYEFLPGWPSIIVAILFSTGLIMLSIGIMGIYIGKIFEQTKDRPIFIIEEELNF